MCRYIRKLEEAVKGKNEIELKSDDNKLKLSALRTISNINILIRDLFRSQPKFKCEIQLSWMADRNVKTSISNCKKRRAPITSEDRNDSKREDIKRRKIFVDQKIYLPPSGKYSTKVQNYHKINNGNNNVHNRVRSRPNGRGHSGNAGGVAPVPYIRNRHYIRKY